MTDIITQMVIVAIADLHVHLLQSHELCFSGERCLYPWNARAIEQTMKLCLEAQQIVAASV